MGLITPFLSLKINLWITQTATHRMIRSLQIFNPKLSFSCGLIKVLAALAHGGIF